MSRNVPEFTMQLRPRATRQKREDHGKGEECLDKDRISKLPEDILVSILSRLALTEAARTSILAQRWRYLWRYSTKLSLHDKEEHEIVNWSSTYKSVKVNRYVKSLNKVLRMHRAVSLDEFRVCFFLGSGHKKHLDKWIGYALCREVKKLEVNLCQQCHHYTHKLYRFPEKYFTLVENPQGLSSTKSLKSLCLKWLDVSGEVIQSFLHNFPLLEHVVVQGTSEMTDLKVVGSSLRLKHLELTRCSKLCNIQIVAPNLVSLKCDWPQSTKVDLWDAPRLIDLCTYRGEELLSNGLVSSARIFSQLETLTLDLFGRCNKHICLLRFPEFTNLKHLILKGLIVEKWSLLCLVLLIKAATFLQKLSLKFTCMISRCTYDEDLPKSPHEHLKVVEIFGFGWNASDIEFAIYLLEMGITLEELIVHPDFKDLGLIQPTNVFDKLEKKLPAGAKLVIV
ncbi:FBD domain [Dillenia turbinata]|uniref:FBD domain n=1 Tax=Dillenia turbinata TaxID=194707 RepID=A0AAN8UZW9_9MAGN